MANGRGGQRTPRNPAPVSGPGELSRRTDGQPIRELPDAAHGEGKQFRELQQAAPVPQAQPINRSSIVGFGEGTQRPDEPVTAGADVLPGFSNREDELLRLRTYLRPLKFLASLPGASHSTRQLVRQLQGAR